MLGTSSARTSALIRRLAKPADNELDATLVQRVQSGYGVTAESARTLVERVVTKNVNQILQQLKDSK